jgi:hypothetical protein
MPGTVGGSFFLIPSLKDADLNPFCGAVSIQVGRATPEVDMKFAGFGVLLIGFGVFGVRVDAHATGRFADVQIIDRDTGGVLPMYRSHGEYWVAGRPGARYSIMIQNRRGERVLAVTAVDGINVISGETGAWGQSGYVFSPGESYEITGWRKSNAEIAAFNFTAAGNSYAERTGRPANVGVIGVALFLERPARAAPQSRGEAAASAPKLEEIKPSTAPNVAQMAPAPKLGTGHGPRETSYAQTTTFDRLSSTPNEVIKIRYDSFENLLAMGVVPSRPWQSTPNPFPDSAMPRYVPDPPGG